MTLAETCIALTIIGILGTLAVPGARRGLDAIRVRSARDAAFGALARTRAHALERGGAELVVDVTGNAAQIVAAGHAVHLTSFDAYGVRVAVDGASSRVAIPYDARGIGRMASRTLRFRRGDAEAGLTVSTYGRVRRW